MAKRKYTSKCQTCSGNRSLKKSPPRPYGATGTNPYCPVCDVDYVYSVSKKSERMKIKNKIKKELS